MIGDFLYGLTPRDSAVTGIELLNRKVVTHDAGNPAMVATYQVPPGRLLRLTNLWAEVGAGGVTYVVNTELFFNPDFLVSINTPLKLPTVATAGQGFQKGLLGVYDFSTVADHVAGLGVNYGWSGEIWLPERATVGLSAQFSASDANSVLVLVLNGILIPRGTVVI